MDKSDGLIILPEKKVSEVEDSLNENVCYQLMSSFIGQGKRVLDAGCGNGKKLFKLVSRIDSGIGVDISEDALTNVQEIKKRKRIENVQFIYADIGELPFQEGTFDIVLCMDGVLEYSNLYGRHESVVREFHRVLCKGGLAIAELANYGWDYNPNSPSFCSSFFVRGGKEKFMFNRTTRETANGLITYRRYRVVTGTPLHGWLIKQKDISDTQVLEVVEKSPLPCQWLSFEEICKHRAFTPRTLKRLYLKAGFGLVDVYQYGVTAEIIGKTDVTKKLENKDLTRLALAEAQMLIQKKKSFGPYLFIVAIK